MCTLAAYFDHLGLSGYVATVVAAATATRTLAGPDGQAVPAAALQAASLAGLADLVAVVAPNVAAIPD
ncbi:hypothetical protein [Mycolicibacterium sp. TY81]|uniref:hypothetical protein n=1 Tax=unclassified Mycolicibacterium TaxID=2636767 RepID=UPI0035301BF1